jgi:hypothetical protein
MSTNPEHRPSGEDEILNLLSSWLAFHRSNVVLRAGLETIGTEGLDPAQAEAVAELLAELEDEESSAQGDVERLVRETLEAIALGG